jgi:hypothetical protein
MRLNSIVVLILTGSFAMSGFSQVPVSEQKVRAVLQREGDDQKPPTDGVMRLRDSLRMLGTDGEVTAVLLSLINKHKYAERRTPDYIVLNSSVIVLGAFGANSANQLLSSVLTDPKVDSIIRAGAARSLGQIDPEGNKDTLLGALNPTASDYYLIRVFAAEGLAKTKDDEALRALERYGRDERDQYVRQQFEKAGQEIRANKLKPN